MKIMMLVYPGMTVLDMIGPAQTWAMWPGAQVQYVWKTAGPVMTDCGLPIVATHAFADAWDTPDILFTGGGAQPTFELMVDDEVLAFMAGRGARAQWVTSVCTGSMILGAAGLLRGYKATSHWAFRDAVALFGATPTAGRYVIDRNRATGGGVTAGIDFGLAVMAHIAGEDIARMSQLMMEYAPAPPFDSGTPETARPDTVAQLSGSLGGSASPIPALLERASKRLGIAA